ncbi:MAG TPA: hypothetical protein VF017_17520 [Thermoanaerobaculia bacterium]|nr:hypothetical protein [Thermoanaerobaculia bacterium]
MVRKPGNVLGYGPEDFRNFKLHDVVTVSERTTSSDYDFYTRELVVTSPLGRQSRSVKDEIGRLVGAQAPGVDPVSYHYDLDGRISQVTQGGRTTS